MASSSVSDRVPSADATQFNDIRDDENGSRWNNNLFIQTDRIRANEVADESQLPLTGAHGRPLGPDRHGNAERTAVPGTPSPSQSPARSGKRGATSAPPRTLRSQSREKPPAPVTPTEPVAQEQEADTLTNLTKRVTELEKMLSAKTFNLTLNMNDLANDNARSFNDVKDKISALDKGMVDTGVGLIQRFSEVESLVFDLSERMVDLNLVIKSLNSPKPLSFRMETPTSSTQPPAPPGMTPTDMPAGSIDPNTQLPYAWNKPTEPKNEAPAWTAHAHAQPPVASPANTSGSSRQQATITSTNQVTNIPVVSNVEYMPEHQTTQQDFGNVRQHAIPSSGVPTGTYAPD